MKILIFLLFPIYLFAQPAIIPYPQSYTALKGITNIKACNGIDISDPALAQEVVLLKKHFPFLVKGKSIQLSLSAVKATMHAEEAYELIVQNNTINLKANTTHGIYNGIQTLLQLLDKKGSIQNCVIKDWPAFSWRGHMIDVGRNYISMDRLKEMIDIMGRYKLNVFHFHLTEDIAWRMAIKQYPQLTSASNMMRNPGKFYSEADIKELIQYCKERHILFVPEIDMPGHSAAFKRAMHTDMQSDSGLAIVKNILKEFCETYDVPFIHIGADEVKITNPSFIPEVTCLISTYGKQVIGWQPGGNFSEQTIRQLWMENNGERELKPDYRIIDSRHLYLNHMDPEEALVSLYNRQIAGTAFGDSLLWGGTICTWHDRNIRSEEDIFTMNPVYPGIIAFAERSWKGGGKKGWIANISDGDVYGFREFEKRILTHKNIYFKTIAFPYYKQSHLTWTLEVPTLEVPTLEVVGGTIVLKHWWHPLIQGAIKAPKENSKVIAKTKLWSDKQASVPCRIGFYDISRSQATDPPPIGKWDHKDSKVFVNGVSIIAPIWKRGGQNGDLEIPLEDEGYSYRPPTMITLKKGWNDVRIEAPIGSFTGKNWNNPVKWMFTFIPEK